MTGPVSEAERTQSKSMDLRPIEAEQRIYSGSDMAILWLGLVTNITSFYIAGTLVEDGMSWWQGIITIFTANLILLAVLILSAHPGTRYGIPFPVIVRSSFGIRGAHFATLLRALVACGWYGIETWIGGQALFICLPSSVKHSSFSSTLSWLGTSPSEFVCFLVFWVAQLAILCKGMVGIYYLEKYCTPILVLLTISLFFWAYFKAGGLGIMLSLPSRLSMSEFWSLFFPSLTACIGTWATLALNIPDFSRYARNQKDQILGQMGLPLFSAAFAFIGLAVASSSGVIFGHVISNPITLLGEIRGIVAKILILVGILLAVLTTNIPANIVAPANALVNVSPTHFTFWRGALLTAVLSFFFLPWRIFQSTDNFVYTWLDTLQFWVQCWV